MENKVKYNILPAPKSIEFKSGSFALSGCEIAVSDGLDDRIKSAAGKVLSALDEKTGQSHNFTAYGGKGVIAVNKYDGIKPQGYKITVDKDNVSIIGGDDAG